MPIYLPDEAPAWVEAIVEANPNFEIRGWCLHCGEDRLMVGGVSKPCRGCGAEYGLIAGPDGKRPPRPGEVGLENSTAVQGTLFDA